MATQPVRPRELEKPKAQHLHARRDGASPRHDWPGARPIRCESFDAADALHVELGSRLGLGPLRRETVLSRQVVQGAKAGTFSLARRIEADQRLPSRREGLEMEGVLPALRDVGTATE